MLAETVPVYGACEVVRASNGDGEPLPSCRSSLAANIVHIVHNKERNRILSDNEMQNR